VVDLSTGATRTWTHHELGLRFRGSDLDDRRVVVEARLRVEPGDATEAQRVIDDIVKWRRENQPGGQNAGSVFVNPIPGVLSAGELIDRAGLRGFRIGTAEVSAKHANFIQADEGGRASDVMAVMRHVHDLVLSESGHDLRSEVRLVGFA
jgi:UDP-N-acetylmuramate dehydrogenase